MRLLVTAVVAGLLAPAAAVRAQTKKDVPPGTPVTITVTPAPPSTPAWRASPA